MKKITFLILLMAGLSASLYAQLSIDATSTDYTIDFDATLSGVNNDQFDGDGFIPAPSAGQLDSDAWATTGMSDGDSDFGDTKTSGDFARGNSSGGIGTGGFYAFTVGTGNRAFGVQPGSSDFTPGTITLKIFNNTGSTIGSIEADYNIVVYNDQGRANSLNFSYSSNNSTYTDVSALDFTTPEDADTEPSWQTTSRSTTISGLSIANGNYFYIRWSSNDVSGSGSRDEFGVDDIVINAPAGNILPSISNISYSPTPPTSSDAVTITADITDSDGTISTTEINWGLSSGSLTNTVTMTANGGDSYSGTIPAQAGSETVYYEIYAVDNDGGSTTSSEENYAVSMSPGDVIITEIMQNPSDVLDANGEWLELYNTTASDIDIDGWAISDNGSDNHTINNSGTLNVPANGFLVLGKNSTTSTNGGVPVDYQYSGFELGNADDEIILKSPESVEIDKVEYDGGTVWPDPSGASMAYTGLDSESNNDGSKWTEAVAREKNYTNPGASETDKGSPKTNGLFQNLISSTTWTGTGNWSEGNAVGATNWSNGSPGSNVDVTVNGTLSVDLAISSEVAECKDLTLLSSASLTIPVGNGLTAYGDLDVASSKSRAAATFTINSGVSGDGSFIVDGTITGNVTVNRYVMDNAWHFVTPITMPTTAYDFSTGTVDETWLASHDESSNDYTYITEDDPLSRAQGYTYWIKSGVGAQTNEFTGAIVGADVSASLAFSGSGDNQGWNLIGNPFPSAIDRDNGSWGSNTSGSVYVWDNDYNSGDYRVSGGDLTDNIIPMGQGFFVKASSAGSFTIPEAARVHSTQSFYKMGDSISEFVRIQLDGDGIGNTVFLKFLENATTGFDYALDADKLYSSLEKPQIFIREGEKKLCINANPLLTEEGKTLSMHMEQPADGNFTLTATGLQHIENSILTVEDTKTGTTQNMNEKPVFEFASSVEDNPDRFLLHFAWSPDGFEDTEDVYANIHIYAFGTDVYIRSSEDAIYQKGEVFVYDIMGRELIHQKIAAAELIKIPVKVSNIYLLVKLVKPGSTKTQKVYIK